MPISRIMRWITGGFEAILGIPMFGGLLILSTNYIPLATMLILHIITLILTKDDKGNLRGSILGIVTSCVGWIPFIGMSMHIVTALFLMIDASKPDNEKIHKSSLEGKVNEEGYFS